MGEGKVNGGVFIEEGHHSWSPLTWVCSGPSKKADGLYALQSLAGVMPSPLLFHFPVGRLYSNTVRQSSICNNLNTEQKHDNSYVNVSRRK